MADGALTRILYVEDDDDIRTVAEMALEAVGGFTLAACASGPEALVRAGAFDPQLILLDVMMPGMDGPATLAELRRRDGLERTPVVFMTAKVQPEEVRSYLALGAVDVISKPFDPMTLADRLRDIWARLDG
jgi:two-component system, OmpR family, response regulator